MVSMILLFLCVKHRCKYLGWLCLVEVLYEIVVVLSLLPQLYLYSSALSLIRDISYGILLILFFTYFLLRRDRHEGD